MTDGQLNTSRGDVAALEQSQSVCVAVDDVTHTYRRPGQHATVTAVEHVSFEVRRGTTFGLVGESGSGKSTLGRLILGLESLQRGRIRVQGRDIATLRRAELKRFRSNMQIVLQDPVASLNRRQTARSIIMSPLRIHRVGTRAKRTERVDELIALVGLDPEHLERRPHELSGGQCQRVSIARALALEPALIVLDEPTSALDVSVQAQVLNLLRDLQARLSLTYLIISHDIAVVRYMASTIGVMHRGRLLEVGSRVDVLRNPKNDYTRELVAAQPGSVGAGVRLAAAGTGVRVDPGNERQLHSTDFESPPRDH